jgi:hypothetical protein
MTLNGRPGAVPCRPADALGARPATTIRQRAGAEIRAIHLLDRPALIHLLAFMRFP